MSLILDALQQAEHERSGQQAPDRLAAPSLAPPSAPPLAARSAPWMWLAMAVALGALAVLGWQLGNPATPQPARVTPPAAALPATPTAPVGTQFPPHLASAETAPASSAPVEAPPFAPRATTAGAPLSGGPDARTATTASVAPASTATTAWAAAPPAPSPGAAAPGGLASLTPEQRALLPHLNVTGHTYSDNPTLRSLMIDGRMFVEGQALAPGLRLERIGSYQAVFNLRGARFTVDY